jgi:hypothetical protein
MRHITLAGRKFRVPASRPLRLTVGGALVVMGLFGFLPVLGFWMVPVGLTVLSADLPIARRLRRRMDVIVTRRWRSWRGSTDTGDSRS